MKRARHVITEIKRTHEAAEALSQRDFIKVKPNFVNSSVELSI